MANSESRRSFSSCLRWCTLCLPVCNNNHKSKNTKQTSGQQQQQPTDQQTNKLQQGTPPLVLSGSIEKYRRGHREHQHRLFRVKTMVLTGSMRRSHVVIACAAVFFSSCSSFHVSNWRRSISSPRTTSTSVIRQSTTAETETSTVTGFVPKVPATAVRTFLVSSILLGCSMVKSVSPLYCCWCYY